MNSEQVNAKPRSSDLDISRPVWEANSSGAPGQDSGPVDGTEIIEDAQGAIPYWIYPDR